MKNLTFKFLISILVVFAAFSAKQTVSAEAPYSCLPNYFDKINVKSDGVEIIDIQSSGYVNRFVIKPNREINLYAYDNKGNQRFLEEKKKSVFADIGEELGERLELLEWNGNSAIFKLIWQCSEPACKPGESKECIFQVKDKWERKE